MMFLPTLTPSQKTIFPSNGYFYLLAFAPLLFFSCKTDDFKDFGDATVVQEGIFAFPVGTVNFTLADVLANDTNLTIGNDNSIKLIYREDHFFNLSAAKMLEDLTGEIDETFTHTSQIGKVAFNDISKMHKIVFGNMLDDFNDLILANYIQSGEGTMAVIPAFEESINEIEELPAFTDFTSLSIENGYMSLEVTNNLFFDVEDLSISIIDAGNNQVVGLFQFNYLTVGQSETVEIGLAGKNISNQFKVALSTLKSPGTGSQQVLIDLSKQLDFEFSVSDITLDQGIVNLPPSILTSDEITFEFTTSNDERIKSIRFNGAQLAYSISSEIQSDILIKLMFPAITINNIPVIKELSISPTGNSSPVTGTLDFSNSLWELDQDADQDYNRLKVVYEVSMPNGSNGQLAFSSEDEVAISFTMNNLEVEEAVGYFGFRQELFEENTFDLGFNLSIFADQSDPILFSDPEMRIEIHNSFGIPLIGEFNATAFGLFGNEANLNPPKIVINYPDMSEMGQFSPTVFVINKNNSDIVNMLSVYPSYLNYSGSATINPNNDPSKVNFILSTSELDVSVEFGLPFKFSAESLVHRDTSIAADLGLEKGGFTIEDIDSAELKIVYDNGMPLKSTINLIALSATGEETIVVENVQFEAADADASGRVPSNGTVHGEVFILLTSDQLLSLNKADKYIYEIILKTEGNGLTPVAMYTDYRVEMGVGMRMVVRRN